MMKRLKTLRTVLSIKILSYFVLGLLLFFSFKHSHGQNGFVNSYSPSNPVVGDTVEVIFESFFSMHAPNGPTCGRFLSYRDSLLGSNIEFDLYYQLIPFSFNVVQCSRYDTLSFIADSAGTFNLIGYWNLQGVTSQGPFNSPRHNNDSLPITISPITSIKELKKESLVIFPNPVDNEFRVVGDFPNPLKLVSFYDLSGSLVKQIRTSEEQIFVSDLEKGVYLVEILVGNHKATHKLIKK